ncbi:ribonucleoside triphosphate reductase [Rhizophagus clarus]|uniref:ribonucleoside-triphosphate reductase (thioredoxin) n=1 Tax=Rhizophagus clarus TaxID=94130 RepID=A0A8H3LZ92_9GLOM|nr:ribonucleoside triphosphate reductase [Rhizophagus clarus]
MHTKVLSRYTFKKRVFFFQRDFPTSAPVTTFALLFRNISYQNFSIPKPNFWIKNFSTAYPSTAIPADLVAKYKDIAPPFGFNGLGEIVYQRTYSRLKANDEKEQWWETVERVVKGTFNMQKRWAEQNNLAWDSTQAQELAHSMYDKIFNMKFLPPGRGLWAMGSPLTEERGIFASLNSCAFVSTENMWDDRSSISKPFIFLMDASMLGVGVGFDTKGAGPNSPIIRGPSTLRAPTVYVIEDSREGWVKSVGLLIDSYFNENVGPYEFDYRRIRPPNLPIKGFGGVSSGPEPLRQLHIHISKTLCKNIGAPLSVTTIVDLMNLIGKCVVSGNIRRAAEIAFGDPQDDEYIDLKNYEINPHRREYGWTSNNSVFSPLGLDYTKICERIKKNGEPGLVWLDNSRAYSRMCDLPDHKDINAREDFLDTLRSAFLYAKTVTLGKTHWPQSNAVMLRNRRIGCGLSGVAQFISQHGLSKLKLWCEEGYKYIQNVDKEFSEWFGIPKSIKTTTIKPSGTVSLLAGATPGMHYPESRYCIRRVRLSKHSEIIQPLKEFGFKIELDVVDPNSFVVEIPIDYGKGVRSLKEVSMWEQLSLAAFLQKYWSDNQVSCTVTFEPETEGPMLKYAIEYFQYQLKGVSFFPRTPSAVYAQMPIEAISPERYESIMSARKNLKVDFHNILSKDKSAPDIERYCDSNTCALDPV